MATTIQVDEDRKERLKRLKVGSMTYDDVITHLLAEIDGGEFRRAALEWQAGMAARIRSNPRNRRIN